MKCEKTCLVLLISIVVESCSLIISKEPNKIWRQENQYILEEGEHNTGKCYLPLNTLQANKEPIFIDTKFERLARPKFLKPGRRIVSWYPQVFLCHKKSNHTITTFYSSHWVYGQALDENTRQSIGQDGRELKNERIYRKVNQKISFDEALGFGAGDEFIKDDGKSMLANSQLAPEEDFVYSSEQMMTQNYLNTAPQWLAIKHGNWLRIEKYIRKLAVKVGSRDGVLMRT